MTTNKFWLLPLAIGFLIYILADSFLPEGPYKVALEIFLFIGAMVYCGFVGRQAYNARRNRDSANTKTEIVKSTREEPLSNTDITFLKKKMNRTMAAAIGSFLFIFCIYLVVTNFFLPVLFGQLGEYLFWILSGAIFVAASYLFGKRIYKLRQDIGTGKKLVVVGNLLDWRPYQYNENDYVFYVDEIAFTVKRAVFEKYAKGDAIEVHLFEPWQNTLLFEKKIDNTVSA
jgi:hypothetical protein